MEHSVQILKFGGTSVGNGERIRHVAGVIAEHRRRPQEGFPVVVVSAMSGVTDQLLRIARAAYSGEEETWREELDDLRQRHRQAAEQAVYDDHVRQALLADLEAAFASLEQDIIDAARHAQDSLQKGKARLVKGEVPVSGAHPGRDESRPYEGRGWTLDAAAISAWGERIAVLLLAAACQDSDLQSVPVREEVIITAEIQHETLSSKGTVTGADPLPAETRSNARRLLLPLVEQGIVPVSPGFIGRSLQGHVTTLGRNGSDYSATVIGEALDCLEVTIYTDVDGVLSADPRIVANARLLPHLSYAEAARLSWFGAKVLHPRTLIPVAQRNIPVRVRNTFHPHTRGTLVGPERHARSGAAAITVRRDLALITVENTDLFGAPENAGQVFELAARAGAAPVAICSSSGHHLSFVVEEQAVEPVVALLQQDMGSWRVRSRRGLVACACIGSGFTADPMSAARATTALARERIPVISQGASDTGIILIVEAGDSDQALRSLHRDLIAPVIPIVRQDKREKSAGQVRL